MIPLLRQGMSFPPPDQALRTPNGLLAMGGELSPARLIDAYSKGIFPWFNVADPILWWSPDPRMVLFPDEFMISRSLRKTLRGQKYEIRTDSAFEQVMRACAAPRDKVAATWIHDSMIAAYTELHGMGIAHSVETWINGSLAGGLYGIGIGRMFYGESMFSRTTNASKIALAHLVAQLRRWNYGMIDCQMSTAHLASLGAREISRKEFMQRLKVLVNYPNSQHKWQFDHEPVA